MSMFFASSGSPTYKYNGVLAGLPATCAVGDLAFVTNATAGQNIYECTAANTWTQQAGGGAGGSVSVNGAAVTTPNFGFTTAFDQVQADRFLVSGSNISATSMYPKVNNCAVFGDSTDTDATPSSGAIVPTWANGFHYGWSGMLFTNECTGWQGIQSTSGDMAADMATKVFGQLGSTWLQSSTGLGLQRPASVIMKIGVNDANFRTNSTHQTTIFRPEIYAAVVAAAIPTNGKTYGQAAACTATGTWSNDNTLLTGMGKVSNTLNDTLSCAGIVTTAASPWIYVAYRAIDTNGGTFTIKVDGATCTDSVTGVSTITAQGGAAIASTNGLTTAPFVARCAASAGSHTVLITVTSATNAANKVPIQFVAAMPAISGNRDNIARTLMAGVLPQRSDTNSTWTRAYDRETAQVVAKLVGDGIPVQFVPVHTYTVATLDPSPVTNEINDISDGTSATDCTVGGGSTMVRCFYSGSAWVAQTGITPVNISTTAGLWTDGLHPADSVHQSIHEQIAAFLPSGASQFSMNQGFIQSGATAFTSAPLVCLSNNQGELAVGDCRAYGNFNKNFNAHNINAESAFQLYDANKTNNIGAWGSKQLQLTSDSFIYFSTSTTGVGTPQTMLSGSTAGVVSFDTSSASNGLGRWISGGPNFANGNRAFVASDFTTSGVGTSLEAITGLTFTLPANLAVNVSFSCYLIYHQNSANVAVAFGVKNSVTPTQLNALGYINTSATVFAAANLVALASTTATAVVSGTPSAITTNFNAELHGMIEQPSGSANTVTVLVSTATAGDTVTVKRGSYCILGA